jgi:hypothetical protein
MLKTSIERKRNKHSSMHRTAHHHQRGGYVNMCCEARCTLARDPACLCARARSNLSSVAVVEQAGAMIAASKYSTTKMVAF